MVSLGMFASYALSIARRSRGFIAGSAPPRRAATVTSLMSRVKILPFLASAAAFLCLTLAHLECPAMAAARLAFGKAYNFGMYPLTPSNVRWILMLPWQGCLFLDAKYRVVYELLKTPLIA